MTNLNCTTETVIFFIYKAIFLTLKTTTSARQTDDIVAIAESFNNISLEYSFIRSLIDKLSELIKRIFSATISSNSTKTLLIIVAVIQTEVALKITKKMAATVDNNKNGQYAKIILNKRI